MAEFDIASLFRQAFAIERGRPYDGSQAQPPVINKAPGFPETPDSGSLEGSEFVNMRNTLSSQTPLGTVLFMPVSIGGVLLPNEPSVSVSSRKNIVETALVGSTRRGTVKELISIEDWVITVRGIAYNYDSKIYYPEDQVKALNDLYDRNESLEIKCALTSLLGIYRVVIKDFLMPEMIGVQNAQAYQFNLVSDEDFILEL